MHCIRFSSCFCLEVFPVYQQKSILMDGAAMDRTLMRIAHEILERCDGDFVLLGIRRRGIPLARQLAANIEKVAGKAVPVGELDVTSFRDDLPDRGIPAGLDLGLDVGGQTVILVDDVLYTGRTIRAAMDAVISAGRPRAIRLAVLIDRGHRELPIRPDFVGKNIPTSHKERIEVRLPDYDGRKEVAILGLTE